MAQTREEINTWLRAQTPVVRIMENGLERVLNQSEYEAMMTEWVEREYQRQVRTETVAAATTPLRVTQPELDSIRPLIDKLLLDQSLTAQEMKLVFKVLIKFVCRAYLDGSGQLKAPE